MSLLERTVVKQGDVTRVHSFRSIARKGHPASERDVGICNLFCISTDIKPNIVKALVTRSFPPACCWEAAVFRGCDLTGYKEIPQQHQQLKPAQFHSEISAAGICRAAKTPSECHRASMRTGGVSHQYPVLGNQHLPGPLAPEYALPNLFFC